MGEYALVNAENYHPVIERAQLKYEDNFRRLTSGFLSLETMELSGSSSRFSRFQTKRRSSRLGRNMGETIQVVSDHGVERLRYSGVEFVRKPETTSIAR